jgi:nucleoid DNA-binding protein
MTVKRLIPTARRKDVKPIGSTLTKRDLAQRMATSLAQEGVIISARAANKILDSILGEITQHLANGGPAVTLRGLGTFKLHARKSFSTVNPRTGVPMDVSARQGVTFKASRDLMSRIN